jgi:hypothetical protein
MNLKIIGTIPPNIAILYGGICWQEMPWKTVLDKYDIIDLYKLSKRRFGRNELNLLKHDIIIIPWAPDQIFLKNNRKNFISFLKNGGILLAFGEFDENWIPNTHWRFELINQIQIANTDFKNSIFHDLKDEDLQDWDDTAHGFFTGISKQCKVIARGLTEKKTWEPIAFVDDKSYVGAILVMSIDADFHTYNGIESAERLLNNCINWALETYFELPPQVKQGFRRRINRKMFLIKSIVIIIANLVVGILTSLLGYYILKKILDI